MEWLRSVLWFLRQWPFRANALIFSTKSWLAADASLRTHYENGYRGWYQSSVAASRRVHPGIEIIRGIPLPQFRNIHLQQFAETGLYFLPDSYIFSEWGAVLSSRNALHTEFLQFYTGASVGHSRFGKPFGTLSWNVERRKDWVALLAAPGGPENYYHWILDILPRIHLLGDFREAVDCFAVPAKLTPAQIESLSAFGINRNAMLLLEEKTKVFCERLLVPTLPGSDGNTPDWAIQALRDACLPLVKDRPRAKRKVYLVRGGTHRRPVVNEEEVIEYVAARGFEPVSLSGDSFSLQVETFRDAELIVAPHGAPLVNLVFAQKASILEVFHPNSISPCYCSLALQCGHRYRHMFGASAKARTAKEFNAMRIDIHSLGSQLDLLESDQPYL